MTARATLVTALVALALGMAGDPAASMAQATTASLSDSARRLDSLAMALRQPPLPANRRRAVELWTDAAALYRQLGDRAREGAMLRNAALRHTSADTAATYLHAALGLARQAGDRAGEGRALFHLGANAFARGQFDSAGALLPRAAQIAREVGERWSERAVVFHAMGWMLWQLSDLDAADASLRDALALVRRVGDRRAESAALGDIGNVFAQRGRHDSTFAYFQAALDVVRAIGDKGGEALWLYNLGALHEELGRPDSALVYLRSSLALARGAGRTHMTAASLNGIGNVLRDLGRPDSALVALREAEQVARTHQHPDVLAEILRNLGKQEQLQHRWDAARARFQEAHDLYRGVGRAPGVASTLAAIAELHEAVGRLDSARIAYDEGLALARASQKPATEAEILRNLGALHARVGDRQALARAVAHFDSAAAIRGALLVRVGTDASRVSFAETGTGLFERWALAWLARAPEIGERESALAALAVAERGRAQALLELLRRGEGAEAVRRRLGTERSDTPGADLVREGERIAATARATGAPVLALLSTPDTLVGWLVLPSGEVTVARQSIGRDSIGQLVTAVRAALGVDEGGARALRAVEPSTRRVGRRATAAIGRLTGFTLPVELTRRLSTAGDLVIVASGPLALVPFAALPLGPAGEPLGVRHAVRYAPSIATLGVMQASAGGIAARRDAIGSALVVGNPLMPSVRSSTGRTLRLPALPAAEREARWVADMLRASPLTGRDATERAVRDRLAASPVVHLATHGFAFSAEARSLDSFVAFAPDSASDGLLTVGEVLGDASRLTAELVVLSACQTGMGNLQQAEGTVGLQRAFLARGARSVLVSLWSVSDDATELLMRRFYSHWLRDADAPGKAEALRRAQRDVRATPRFRAPRYWAAFQLVGAS
ncbi:CHAT domain-containing tetratricopeptide repeat protein [Roseisolibacter agri]|uniref:CHAT domain-containing protein n=1 Tax=Roseisolibacter agri TaxID=2014610 RepID=A0AA37QFQ0_9BACT|nr:CHAT domain-containing protein [Roseisolibacter agri]GLC24908.1 hypothetical protein rosag_14210 [Roseisolibacter agri]